MIQFLRFNAERTTGNKYDFISGREAVRFFIKKSVCLILFIYATFFIAAAIPFVVTPFIPIYFIGAFASAICLIRLISHIRMFRKYKGGHVSVNQEGVSVKEHESDFLIQESSIKYIEYNVLGNVVIHEKQKSIPVPVGLLSKTDREAFFNEFQDMSPWRTAAFRKIWEIIDAVAVALFLAVHIIQYIVQAYYIPTGSMEDTLLVGDHLFVEKVTYGPIIPQMMFMDKPVRIKFLSACDIKRNDIVIFRPPHDQDKDYIKRCIAVPGDLLELKDGAVYVNNEKLDEPYVGGKPTRADGPFSSQIQGVVPEGRLVVFGDNRTNSQDSRYFGYLDVERVKGRALIMYWNSEYVINRHDFSRFKLIR
ncbi:MAG: signal peptidase I [Leptospirales bacterium]|nr:signal peptidase I [Leptospirales bacterium]